MKLTISQLNDQAKRCAKAIQLSEGELLEVLIEMRKENAFIELGYQGVWEYCFKELKFSAEQANYYKRTVLKVEEVPALGIAITQGTLSLSAARRIVPVVTNENLSTWIESTKKLTQVELEKAVSLANPQAKPREKLKPIAKNANRLDISINDLAYQDAKVLLDILSTKLKRPATLAEVIELALQITRDKLDPERKATRSISSGNAKAPKPGRQVIPAPVKHAVVRRQGYQCAYRTNGKRCDQRRYLHYHHRTPVTAGGLNTVDNLVLLCSAHHRFWHIRPPHRLCEEAVRPTRQSTVEPMTPAYSQIG